MSNEEHDTKHTRMYTVTSEESRAHSTMVNTSRMLYDKHLVTHQVLAAKAHADQAALAHVTRAYNSAALYLEDLRKSPLSNPSSMANVIHELLHHMFLLNRQMPITAASDIAFLSAMKESLSADGLRVSEDEVEQAVKKDAIDKAARMARMSDE